MNFVSFDAVQYVLLKAMKDLQKAGRNDLAKLVEGLARDLQENLDEIRVERCPFCRGWFGNGKTY